MPRPVDDERWARAAWSRLAEPDDKRAREFVTHTGVCASLEAVHAGERAEVQAYQARLARLDVAQDVANAHRVGARVVIPGDADWPEGLDDLEDPPYCLWVRGSAPLQALRRSGVSIVGARASTPYGDDVAGRMAAELAEAGFTVVSGAAFGVDKAAHIGALQVRGCTVAVLAGGVERPYPQAHAALLAEIAATGAVLSEVPPGSAPTRNRFLARNRIIALLTCGTVVVEAGLRSGALHTARTADRHHRPVGAVPGPVGSMVSAGCHQEIREGRATLVTDAADVRDLIGGFGVDAVPWRSDPVRAEDEVDDVARGVLSSLPYRAPVAVGSLAVQVGRAEGEVMAALARLELVGLARRRDGGWTKVPRP